jgi:hypothetical protein
MAARESAVRKGRSAGEILAGASALCSQIAYQLRF